MLEERAPFDILRAQLPAAMDKDTLVVRGAGALLQIVIHFFCRPAHLPTQAQFMSHTGCDESDVCIATLMVRDCALCCSSSRMIAPRVAYS